MAKNNSRGVPPSASPNRALFFGVLIAIAVIGVGTLLYLNKSSATTAEANAAYAALQRQYATAGPPQPHTLGDSSAPVTIEEFADFECPSCGRFATITEPDVRKQLIETGKVYYKYYDFPLPMHKNSPAASMAAACADEQGKFWPMHDALFGGQDQWGLAGESQVTDDPKPVFLGYAKQIGLDVTQWEQCFDSKKEQGRINGNAGEALRRNVNETPTFYVNGTKQSGAVTYDEMLKLVTAAAKRGPMSAADSAVNNVVKH